MDKDRYRQFSENNNSIPIFSKGWWLDIVCGNEQWDVVYIEKNSKIIASLPYYKKEKFGTKLLLMPPLTQHLGIWIDYDKNLSYYKTLSYEKKIMSDLIKLLPKYDRFSQNFYYKYQNWLPFYWAGYNQTTKYTYVIENISDLDSVFSNFRSNLKNQIKNAQKVVNVKETTNVELLYKLIELTYRRQNKNFKFSFDLVDCVFKEAYKKDKAMILTAEDHQDNIHAAIMVIWDIESAYYLLSGTNPVYKNSNASGLLIWEAIKKLSGKTNKFDMEGSMIEQIESFFRTFGAKQKPYSNIYKIKNKILKFKRAFFSK